MKDKLISVKSGLTEREIRELEIQLSCPSGEMGISVGKKLHETNISMTLSSINFLDIKESNVILELGHGNCGHLNELMAVAKDINFYGLEVSETMWKEALKMNAAPQATFALYDGINIPYKDHFFDKIMSVNTIYFWSHPFQLIIEMERTLKPNGICVLTYGNKAFMQKLPVVGEKFKLYGRSEIEDLVKMTSLKIIDSKDVTEQVVDGKSGETVERRYSMTKLQKL